MLKRGKSPKKRLQLQLDADLYDIIKELAELSGMSASSLVRLMFEDSKYRMISLRDQLSGLRQTPDKLYQGMVRHLESSGPRQEGNVFGIIPNYSRPSRAQGSLKFKDD